ncbi:PAS domain-containing protein [Flavonifractor plautii]|uniref:PAS domain-containing protein n=1 Tax=Flavonifractor plautii TaxID=292800 RepID=UPI003EEF77A5
MASQLLQQYVKLTEFLGHTLGPDYEVALHDLTDRTDPLWLSPTAMSAAGNWGRR